MIQFDAATITATDRLIALGFHAYIIKGNIFDQGIGAALNQTGPLAAQPHVGKRDTGNTRKRDAWFDGNTNGVITAMDHHIGKYHIADIGRSVAIMGFHVAMREIEINTVAAAIQHQI